MRLQRLKLRNVRGAAHREVSLLPDGISTGVVIVEGPNESGKSTLGDAFDVLLRYKASSGHRDVRSLQTEGLDEPAEVEAELVAGPYRFTYRKRFGRRAATELEIHEPHGLRLTGDDAHERVDSILDETIDRDLWEALRLRQAAGLSQADVTASHGLAAALEQRTDACAISDRELEVLEAVEAEYLRYFTDKGNERKQPLGEARARVAAEQHALAGIDRMREQLQADVDRAAAIERDLPARQAHLQEAWERAHELAQRRAEVETLERDVEQREGELATATAQAEHLAERLVHRRKLVTELADGERAHADLAADLATTEARRAEAQARKEEAQEALTAAQERQRGARATRERAQADLDHLHAHAELAAVRRRVEEAEEARGRLHDAEFRGGSLVVDDALLAELRHATSEFDQTQAALDAASPEVTFRAAAGTTVLVDGAEERLEAGTSCGWTVRGTFVLGLSDVGAVVVRSGAGTEDAVAAHDAAAHALDEALCRAGVSDLTAAEAAHRARRDAQADAADARRDLDRALDGDTLDALTERRERLTLQVEAYLTDRVEELPLPADVDEARHALEDATQAERAADRAVVGTAADLEEARVAHDAQREAAIGRRARATELAHRVTTLGAELADMRAAVSDDVLAKEAEEAKTALTAAEQALDAARRALDAAEPETVLAQAENAAEVVDDAARQLEAAEQELRDLRTSIRVRGGEGLHEQREGQATVLEHARAELASLERRADATRVLFTTLDRHRSEVADRYAAPLRDEIVRFARMLYGPEFDVELDEDLRVTRRHLDGLWLDLGQLSVGAREQLALLGRLACAVLLADQGGLLLFDDALGNTDAERLEAVGAVLRLAGEHCQVVVLTCYPDRYRHVGGATRVALK